MIEGARDDWEPVDHDHRVGSVIAAALAAVALGWMLAGCAPAVHAPRTGEMPGGVGPMQYEAGFSRFCRDNPHVSLCP